MTPLPTARVEVRPRRSWAWLLPLLAGLFAALLAYQGWVGSGRRITVRAREGHGIKAGDPLRYRGITIGTVEDVRLASSLSDVILVVRLEPAAGRVARAGSRFWIVRPELSLEGVQGLETIVGARYVAVLPGDPDNAPQAEFFALDQAPVGEPLDGGGLEITLEAPKRFGLAPGAPLAYREIQVGTVLSVGLSSDATAVEVRAYVRPAFVQLVREDTRFWETGGLEVRAEIVGGLSVEVQSLRSLLSGSIALATPTQPGAPVNSGHRFTLHEEPEPEWTRWRPALPIGASLAPAGLALPRPQRGVLTWEKGRFLPRSRDRQGWLLPVEGGLLGPEDLLVVPSGAREGRAVLEVGGEALELPPEPQWQGAGLARVALDLRGARPWPASRMRHPSAAEDCLVIGDSAVSALSLSLARVTPEEGRWRVDPALAFADEWHGACVVARSDGALVGMLLVEGGAAHVAPVPSDL